MVDQANNICREYADQGYDLTLRQLYYQFVARDLIPNRQQSYKRLGDIVNKARLAGLLDWNYIVDRTRNLSTLGHWLTPADIIQSAARSFALDKWSNQPVRVEVWVEKEALAGVVQRIAETWDVPWFSCRGYVSQSELWSAAQRHLKYIQNKQRVVVIHLGDHDPSGIDMTRDNEDRLNTFLSQDWLNKQMDVEGTVRETDIFAHIREHLGMSSYTDNPITVNRIALNMNQIEEYNPPPNPTKFTDSRAEGYVQHFGDESWELDALPPDVLAELIREAILEVMDVDLYDATQDEEEEHRKILTSASRRWMSVRQFLENLENE
jgi:hypothetical protein